MKIEFGGFYSPNPDYKIAKNFWTKSYNIFIETFTSL